MLRWRTGCVLALRPPILLLPGHPGPVRCAEVLRRSRGCRNEYPAHHRGRLETHRMLRPPRQACLLPRAAESEAVRSRGSGAHRARALHPIAQDAVAARHLRSMRRGGRDGKHGFRTAGSRGRRGRWARFFTGGLNQKALSITCPGWID